jgi:hypothetical protein
MLCCVMLCYVRVQSGCERAQLMAWHSGPLLLLLLLECRTPAAAAAAVPLPGPPSLPVSTPASSAADISITSSSSSSSSHTTSQAAAAAATAASLLELLSGPGHALAGQLAGELPAKHLWHVQGLRYLYQDHLAAAMRCAWVGDLSCVQFATGGVVAGRVLDVGAGCVLARSLEARSV